MKIWEEPLIILSYRVRDPDPNPIFYDGRAYQGAQGHVYPYPLLDNLTDIREKRTYKAIFLENKYIKICVLPEIGGRIFSAVDKTNNYDFIYQQHVIKPALIGMLGAWISGGVEWNFPHHHRPTTFMPVDYSLQENPDGSKTIWIGEMELRHRMKWIVGLTLHPDKSYIEATVKLFNRTPFAHSFLFWANVAVHANSKYQIIFPPNTEWSTFHGKNQFSHWPISHEVFSGIDYTKGVDVSWWKNHPSLTSFFAWNKEDDFLVGYDHGKQAGTVHVANHHVVPGKKFFEWGSGSEGQMWDKILTETDGPYVELMVGAYSDNQPDYSWIQPYEVKIFKQYWYPIKQIGGVKNANCEAAVNLESTLENTIRIGFNTTSECESAKVLVKAKEEVIFEQIVDISPEKPFATEIHIPQEVREEDIKVALLTSTNQELIAYRPVIKKKTDMPKPVKPPPLPKNIKTIEELYLTALRLEQFHSSTLDPFPYYEEALRRDPGDYRVNTTLGILYCKRGLFKEAVERFSLALERVTRNHTTPKVGEAYYFMGLALKAQEKIKAAYDAFFKATWYHAFHAAAYFSLAELECRKGDFLKALEFIDRSISTNTFNTKALNSKAAVLRRLGYFKESEKLALDVLKIDPLDFYSGNELYLAKSKMGFYTEAIDELDNLKKKMRGNVQSYLELAIDYGNLGLWDEAIEILSRLVDSNNKEIITYPMIYYYLGYFLEKKGETEEARKYCNLASRMPTRYCFPFRLESIDVLRFASKYNDEDARGSYYLGNLLYYFDQPNKAIKEWEKSRSLDNTFSIVHRNLGIAYSRKTPLVKKDLLKAIASLEKAIACNRKDPRLYYELDQLYEVGEVSPTKRLKLLEKNKMIIINSDDALSRMIILHVQLGQYDKAIDLLESIHFHIWEGGGKIHNEYVDAHLLRGFEKFNLGRYLEALEDYKAALKYPENLEVGKPYRGGRHSEIYYFIGTAYEAMSDIEKAKTFYSKSVVSKHGWSKISYYQGLAYQKLGQKEEANKMFDGLIRFGRERLEEHTSVDYFTKFGKKQSEKMRMADAYFLQGLGYLGKDKKEEAEMNFKEALKLNTNHIWARRQLSELK